MFSSGNTRLSIKKIVHENTYSLRLVYSIIATRDFNTEYFFVCLMGK